MTATHHAKHGIFHIVTNTCDGTPWCARPRIPETLIDNLVMTKNVKGAKVYAFSILPQHLHILLNPGPPGLGKFMQSFKRNAMKDIHQIFHAYNRDVVAMTRESPGLVLVAAIRESPLGANRDSRLPPTPQRQYDAIASRQQTMAWQKGYYDRRIRDARQFSAAFHYIEHNAFHHGLVENVGDWPWSSLHYPRLIDMLEGELA